MSSSQEPERRDSIAEVHPAIALQQSRVMALRSALKSPDLPEDVVSDVFSSGCITLGYVLAHEGKEPRTDLNSVRGRASREKALRLLSYLHSALPRVSEGIAARVSDYLDSVELWIGQMSPEEPAPDEPAVLKETLQKVGADAREATEGVDRWPALTERIEEWNSEGSWGLLSSTWTTPRTQTGRAIVTLTDPTSEEVHRFIFPGDFYEVDPNDFDVFLPDRNWDLECPWGNIGEPWFGPYVNLLKLGRCHNYFTMIHPALVDEAGNTIQKGRLEIKKEVHEELGRIESEVDNFGRELARRFFKGESLPGAHPIGIGSGTGVCVIHPTFPVAYVLPNDDLSEEEFAHYFRLIGVEDELHWRREVIKPMLLPVVNGQPVTDPFEPTQGIYMMT